ncbi:hypothetical protein M426DRAFT_47555, partial [Hypoxylon sp. CI-4A]
KKIGDGTCSVVLAQGDATVVKLAKYDHLDLSTDYRMHLYIFEKFREYGVSLLVKLPKPNCYISKSNTSAAYRDRDIENAAREVWHAPTDILFLERVRPLPLFTRVFLIERYFDPAIKEKALKDPENEDCLVRPYLGSMNGRVGRYSSLRNFGLHLNQMIEAELDFQPIAALMGKALATLHWGAKTDARGVEFVLGSSNTTVPETHISNAGVSATKFRFDNGSDSNAAEYMDHRSIDLWLFDFNRVGYITLDKEGVAQAVEAATMNDPYLPLPFAEPGPAQEAWYIFSLFYLNKAGHILRDEYKDVKQLPLLFLGGIVTLEYKK